MGIKRRRIDALLVSEEGLELNNILFLVYYYSQKWDSYLTISYYKKKKKMGCSFVFFFKLRVVTRRQNIKLFNIRIKKFKLVVLLIIISKYEFFNAKIERQNAYLGP